MIFYFCYPNPQCLWDGLEVLRDERKDRGVHWKCKVIIERAEGWLSVRLG
jgi:hypothetical protein